MSQSKRMSAVESFTNQVLGFVISVLLFQYIVGPLLLDIQPNWTDNMVITVVFTVVSTIRSYIVRRVFNNLGGK